MLSRRSNSQTDPLPWWVSASGRRILLSGTGTVESRSPVAPTVRKDREAKWCRESLVGHKQCQDLKGVRREVLGEKGVSGTGVGVLARWGDVV